MTTPQSSFEAAVSEFYSDPKRVIKLPDHELETVSKTVLRKSKNLATLSSQRIDWGLTLCDVQSCWSLHKTRGEGVRVAVLDTGVDRFHEDLSIEDGADFTSSTVGWADLHGHGTHCAGIVAAKDNGVGVVGVAPNAILVCGKVLGDDGSGTLEGIAKGIDWAVTKKADVISMSLGGDGPISGVIRSAIDRAIARGVVVVVAAGNSGAPTFPGGNIGSPGNYNPCVTVGACDKNTQVASFSSRGPEIDVVAPGVEIVSCAPGQRYVAMSGTSMATPFVAGLAAIFVQKCRLLNVKSSLTMQKLFENYIRFSAKDLGSRGFDNDSGAGLVQPVVMLSNLTKDFTPVPPPPPPTPPPTGANLVVTLADGRTMQINGVVNIAVANVTGQKK